MVDHHGRIIGQTGRADGGSRLATCVAQLGEGNRSNARPPQHMKRHVRTVKCVIEGKHIVATLGGHAVLAKFRY